MANSKQRVGPSGLIIICGRAYNIGWPVVNWFDNPAFSAYRLGCYKGKDGVPAGLLPFAPAKGLGKSPYRYRERRLMGGQRQDLRRLQDIIRQFVVHHDGCASSADCFHVLHDERGLSAHFLIDNNGWIYQTLDLADGAFHASGVNEISIGVELCSRGQVELDGENFYAKRGIRRNITEVVIHNTRYRMWEYTPEQYMAMVALGKALSRLFPNLPQVYPQWNGMMLNTWMADPRAFAGYIGHYHITNNKWDPGCFNFAALVQKIRVSSVWFVCLDKSECAKPPEIAEVPQLAEQQGQVLYRNNEQDSAGGYFPVGPFGRSRLWHGGIHLNLPLGAPVFTPFPGRIVAARFADAVPTGSANFVLMRHYFRLAGVETLFFILYMHLERADPKKGRVPWLAEAEKRPFFSAMSQGEVFSPDIDLGGGEILGHVGEAGPPGSYESQIHLQVMSVEELSAKLEPGFFRAVDGKTSGHFCDAREILTAIDRPKGKGDGILIEREVRDFFQNSDERTEFRKLAVRFQSEWGDAPDWEQQLYTSRDFRALPKPARLRLYREQIKPMLWYTPELAERVGLPKDFVVWHYHPVRFVAWMNSQLRKQATTMVGQIQVAQGPAAAKVTDDRDSIDGFVDEEDEMSPEASRRLTLEDLANGYPDETPGK